ncbi:MAG: IclR family transcriptional regulator [Planctomycetes bacterium]|nr:IclR family transcriptional regulator [Planctomycetota bacterium]
MEQYLTPNLVKALDVLKLLAENEQGLSSSDIEKRISIARTTAFRILKSLCHKEMAQKRGGLYFAGPMLYEVGLQALSRLPLRQRAVPVLQELTRRTGHTSHLAVPSGWHSLILEVCDSSAPIRVASRSGTLADLHRSATGKIFLSYLYRDRLDEFYAEVKPQARTGKTIINIASLRKMTGEVPEQGFAIDNEEYHAGVRCVAAPVFDMQKQVIAAIGITGPAIEISFEMIPSLSKIVIASATDLSRSLGKE